ncbi:MULTISPECIES: hypothetical protein [Deinococcus]|uniref:DUF3806 domain-containing protein n=1 Tax=Deinococcus rufus TaxID=2136097 RepID=A0ABV7Z590_9DEIO|nr:hypothetical protein [Deinococcus sp. AB2017081]WQE95452.1 hypothetical protein U2P90_00825 [Deinococcus sp. AB2017081]
MNVTEIPLDDEEMGSAADFKTLGAARLGQPEDAEPAALVRALREYLDEHRHDAATLAERDEDAYADFILELGYLWGEQLCRTYDWAWIRLHFDGEEGGICIVSPDRSLCVNPTRLFKEIVDEAARANNIQLIYSMVSPEVLAVQFPGRKPGRYTGMY